MIWRVLAGLLALLILVAVGRSIFRGAPHAPAPRGGATVAVAPPADHVNRVPFGPLAPTLPPAPLAIPPGCAAAPDYAGAATQNAASLNTTAWSVFGRPEPGWAVYALLAAHEIGTGCPPEAPGFAAALAKWQGANHLAATGVMDEATLDALRILWLKRRPFDAQTAHGACPPPPPPSELAEASKVEGYHGKPVQLRADVLGAYRAMVAAARREVAAVAADPQMLTLFSGYRGPDEESARCADGGCGTPAKAHCSAHRTGTAMDIYVGNAPGSPPESSADANRLYQTGTPAYRWLVANAARFGFVNYPFEPWHWEWTGAPAPA